MKLPFGIGEDGWALRCVLDAEETSGVVGRTNCADVAAPFAAASLTESPGAIHTDSLGQLYGNQLGLPERTKHVSVR